MSGVLGGYASSSSSSKGADSDGNESDSSSGSKSQGEGIGLRKFKPVNFDEPIKNSVFSHLKEAADKKKEDKEKKEKEAVKKRVMLPPQVATKRRNVNIDRIAERMFEKEESALPSAPTTGTTSGSPKK